MNEKVRSIGVHLLAFALLAVNIYGLFCPIAPNEHIGFLDATGDVWYGYQLVIFGPIFLIGIPFLIGILNVALVAITWKMERSYGILSLCLWFASAPFLMTFALMSVNRYAGFYVVSIPGVLVLIPLILKWNARVPKQDSEV